MNGAYFNHARLDAANCGGGGDCTVNAMTASMGRYEIIFTTVSDWNIRNAVIIVIPNDPFIIPILYIYPCEAYGWTVSLG